MNGDWIKLHRKMLSSAVMQHEGLCHLWIYCLIRANWQDRSILVPGSTKQMLLRRGQFITGRRALHSALYPERDQDGRKIRREHPPPSESTVWRWMQNLETAGQISMKSEQHYTVVTICNYETYQNCETVSEPTMNQPWTNHEPIMNTEEEGKKERRKEKNAAIPPLLESSVLFLELWGSWLGHRTHIRKKLSEETQKRQLKKLEKMGLSRAVAALEHSLDQGYQGIFEPNGPVSRQSDGDDFGGFAITDEAQLRAREGR